MKARAAWHYYVEGLTQEQIADILGIGRIKVHRVLAAAREEGVVQFRIKGSVIRVHPPREAAQGAFWTERRDCRALAFGFSQRHRC